MTPPAPRPRTFNPAIAAAVAAYRTTGNTGPILTALGNPKGAQAVRLLQHHLRAAPTRADRDAIEEAAWQISRGSGSSPSNSWTVANLRQCIAATYGESALTHFPQEEAHTMVTTLLRSLSPAPTENCLLAAIGVEIARRVGNTIPVGSAEFGREVGLHAAKCDHCGGSTGGQGKVVCGVCLKNARSKIEVMVAQGGPIAQLAREMSIDGLATQLIVEKPDAHGCPTCRNKPIRPCQCSWSVQIPASPRDGEVVNGRYTLSGTTKPCVLRVKKA
jgi:hypothetical protein